MRAAVNQRRTSTQASYLSERQQAILEFVYHYTQEYGHAPTVRDIGSGIGIVSTSTVMYHLRHLVAHGYLSKGQGTSRTIVLLPAAHQQITAHTQAREMVALRQENERLRAWCHQLEALAADPDIQREIAAIQTEFAPTEGDGLKDTE